MSDRRKERVRRMVAKRPPGITVEVTHAPCPEARERLLDVLLELLDEHRRSGGSSAP